MEILDLVRKISGAKDKKNVPVGQKSPLPGKKNYHNISFSSTIVVLNNFTGS